MSAILTTSKIDQLDLRKPKKPKLKVYKGDLPYEDVGDYDGNTSYTCPNEDVTAWRKLLGAQKFERAGGICSGGEVGLWAMLPSVTKELLLIDHSYRPLAYAMVKFMLIKRLGFAKARGVFTKLSHWRDLDAHLGREWWKTLPENLQYAEFSAKKRSLKNPLRAPVYSYSQYYSDAAYKARIDREWAEYNAVSGIASTCRAISGYWIGQIAPSKMRYPTSKLALVRFLHGDFRDLDGKFDLFYASNALEGGNGNKADATRGKLVARVDELVKPGGFILSTALRDPETLKKQPYYNLEYYAMKPENWTEVSREGGSWQHVLYQKSS